jgi:hypothetical protein
VQPVERQADRQRLAAYAERGCPELEGGRRVHARGKALRVVALRDDDAK